MRETELNRYKLTAEEQSTLQFLRGGDLAIAEFFNSQRESLKKMIRVRRHSHLQRRLDDSDVVQEAYIKYAREIQQYLENPLIPPVVWLRRLVRQVISRLNRKNIQAQCRDFRREEFSIDASVTIEYLVDSISSVGKYIGLSELRESLRTLVSKMPALEREILSLVHFENRTVRQAAMELGIQLEAAKKRYRRALTRMRNIHESKLRQLGDFGSASI